MLNYLVTCIECNQRVKHQFFPIAGTRKIKPSQHPFNYSEEKPYLIYPLGSIDTDPEELIFFQGYDPYPINQDPNTYPHRRAYVTITLMNLLDDSTLQMERAIILQIIFLQLEKGNVQTAQDVIQRCQTGTMPHTNCARSFIKLYQSDPSKAKTYYDAAVKYLNSKS